MNVSLVAFAQDPRLGGATLSWRPRQIAWLEAFGDDSKRVIVGAAGRQGGKSSLAVVAALWNAAARPDLDALIPRGRTRSVLLISASDEQSRALVSIAGAMIEASPALRQLATIRSGTIRFDLPGGAVTELRSLANNPATIRGRTASMCVLDEFAHSVADVTSWNDAERMLESAEGSMSTFDAHGLSKLIAVSTPNGETGCFHRLYQAAKDGSLPDAQALHATAWELNKRLDSDEWRESKVRLLGQSGFDQEHGAQFVTSGGAFFDLRELTFELDRPAEPEQCDSWVIGLDVAFHSDRCGLAVVGTSRQDPDIFLCGGLWAIEPSGGGRSQADRRAHEDATLTKCWELIQRFRPHNITKIVTDQHDSVSVRSFFEDRGIEVEVVNITGPTLTEQMVMTRSRLTSGSLRCHPDPQLLEDLRRVRARKGSESVVLPRYGGGHADTLAALGQAVYALGGDYSVGFAGAVSHNDGRGWSDGVTGSPADGDPEFGSAEYWKLTAAEQRAICDRRSGIGSGGAAFMIPGNLGAGYDSPGASGWLSGGGIGGYDD